MDGLPDEFFTEHSGETYILNVERVEAEIGRLQAEVTRWSEYESETWKAMKADNERLRAALKLARNYIHDESVAYAVVLPSGKPLIRVVDEALGCNEQKGKSA